MNSKRVSKLFPRLLVLTVLGLTVLTACSGGSSADRLTIAVQGSGQAEGTPDIAYVTMGVSVTHPELGAGIDEATRVNNQINSALIAQGLEEKDIQTSQFNIWREDIYSRDTGEPTGDVLYHVEISVTANIRNIDGLGTILDAALNAGANTVNGIQFGLENTAPLEAEARESAIADMQARAEQLAEGMGYQLGELISVGEGIYGYAAPYVSLGLKGDIAGIGGGGTPSIQPGSTSVSVDLSAVYELAPQ